MLRLISSHVHNEHDAGKPEGWGGCAVRLGDRCVGLRGIWAVPSKDLKKKRSMNGTKPNAFICFLWRIC